MSWAAKSKIQQRAIIPTTATRPPGISLIQRPKTIRIASTAAETSAVCQEPSEMWPSVSKNLTRFSLTNSVDEDCVGTPSIPPTWPIATWTPTPVRKPISTVRERKFGEEAEPRDPREEQQPAASSALRPGEGDPLRRVRLEPGDPERRDSRVHDRRGRRVGADDQVPRRAEQRERRDRDQDRVEAGDHRHPGDLRVAHRLGDRERRERDAGDDVLREPLPLVRPDPVEHRDPPAQPGHRRRAVRHHELDTSAVTSRRII